MSMQDISEEKELRELYVLENPFKQNLQQAVNLPMPQTSDEPGLPIDGKYYPIPRNGYQTDYLLGNHREDTINKSLTGNVAAILKIQNNQTEILTYIVNVLFNEVSTPIKEILKRIKQEIQNLQTAPLEPDSQPIEEVNLEIGTLRIELEEIKKEIEKTNKNLEKLLERI